MLEIRTEMMKDQFTTINRSSTYTPTVINKLYYNEVHEPVGK
jgi:hypothetical protein